jgi:hypothetical protein
MSTCHFKNLLVGLGNLNNNSATEYWSENHVSEDFELMIHLYNLGFNGRYVAYPDCEFQEGITRTFDEEAGRHRKFSLGAHELMFNPFNNWIGEGIFSPLFRTFLKCDIPSYYKIFLTAYLFSYTSGGAYIIVFSLAAIARLVDKEDEVGFFSAFNSAGVLILSILVSEILAGKTKMQIIIVWTVHLTHDDSPSPCRYTTLSDTSPSSSLWFECAGRIRTCCFLNTETDLRCTLSTK